MLSTNDCVPAGVFVQLIAGDVPSPGAAPGAACENFTGICPPSGNPVTVKTMAGAAGAPPRCPRSWALIGIATSRRTIVKRTNHSLVRMLLLLNGECRENASDVNTRKFGND